MLAHAVQEHLHKIFWNMSCQLKTNKTIILLFRLLNYFGKCIQDVDIISPLEVVCSASDRQGLNFESCVWKTVSSHSSHYSQGVLLAQFSLYVHKSGLKPDSFHFALLNPYSLGIDFRCRNLTSVDISI